MGWMPVGTNGYRAGGNITEQTFKHFLSEFCGVFQKERIKLVPQLCNRTVLAGFPVIFQFLILVCNFNQGVCFRGTDQRLPSNFNSIRRAMCSFAKSRSSLAYGAI